MAISRTGPVRRVRRRTPLGVALLLVALAAAGCGTTDDPTSVAAGDGTATTNANAAATTVAEPAGRPSACASVTKTFLTPASSEFAREHLGQDPAIDEAEGDRLIEELIADHPDELDDAFTTLASLVAKSDRGADASDQDLLDLDAAIGTITIWGVQHCDPAEPVWKCFSHRSSFQAVGSAITEDGEGGGGHGEATPEAALGAIEDTDGSTELARADDAVLYGWLDDDGLVERTLEIDQNLDATWSMSSDTSCKDAGGGNTDDGFTPIGGSIPE